MCSNVRKSGRMKRARLLIEVLLVLVIVGAVVNPVTATTNKQTISPSNQIDRAITKCIKTGSCSIGWYTPDKKQVVANLEKSLSEKKRIQITSIDHSGSDSSSKKAYVSVGSGGYMHLDSKLYAAWHLDNPLSKDEVTVSNTHTNAWWGGSNPWNADEIDCTSSLKFSGISISVSVSYPPGATVSPNGDTVTYSHSWHNVWDAAIYWDNVYAEGTWIYQVTQKDTAGFVFGSEAHVLSDQLDVTWYH